MNDSNVITSRQNCKGKTAVSWNDFGDPWRRIGLDFADECANIAAGVELPNRPSCWRARDDSPLKTLRLARGLSQKALSELVRCSTRTIGRLEAGHTLRKTDAADRIRRALEG
jgi:DNA-binding XRE family transcriptional regulator